MGYPEEIFDKSRVCFFLEAPVKLRVMLFYVAIMTFVLSLFYLFSYWEHSSINFFLFSMSFVLSFALVAFWRHVVVIDLNERMLEIRKGFLIPSEVKKLKLEQFTHIGIRSRCIGLLTSPGSRFIIYLYNKNGQYVDISCSRTKLHSREQAHMIAKKIHLSE